MFTRNALIGVALAGALTACTPQIVNGHGPIRVPSSAHPDCTATVIDGVPVVTFMYGDTIRCDVSPPQQLNLVFDESSHEAWGGDAAVQWAADECDHMGGTQLWLQSPYRLICQDVDY